MAFGSAPKIASDRCFWTWKSIEPKFLMQGSSQAYLRAARSDGRNSVPGREMLTVGIRAGYTNQLLYLRIPRRHFFVCHRPINIKAVVAGRFKLVPSPTTSSGIPAVCLATQCAHTNPSVWLLLRKTIFPVPPFRPEMIVVVVVVSAAIKQRDPFTIFLAHAVARSGQRDGELLVMLIRISIRQFPRP